MSYPIKIELDPTSFQVLLECLDSYIKFPNDPEKRLVAGQIKSQIIDEMVKHFTGPEAKHVKI